VGVVGSVNDRSAIASLIPRPVKRFRGKGGGGGRGIEGARLSVMLHGKIVLKVSLYGQTV
jgi:hypothetical protein